ncbi:MAG: MBL fold metallo-hydrolase, partial [Acidobacteriota bacterium]
MPLCDGSGMLLAGEKMAKITFLGGVGTVTGSKYLLEADNTKVLVDCGMFQGLAELRQRNWEDPPFDPASIDAVIITHAHIDHTGYLPRLVKLGFKGPVFTSKATRDLMKILLPDSARLQEEEADYRNRHQLTSHSPALPLYGEAEARDALALINGVDNDGVLIEIASGVRAGFSVAGHIMGASMVLVEIAGAQSDDGPMRFLFSGDLGHYEQPIVRDPAAPPDCDYLMCESTYGDREHGDERSDIQLARLINEAARK